MRTIPTPVRRAEPADAALYRCGCGKGFMAAVSTMVTCPACGELQAW